MKWGSNETGATLRLGDEERRVCSVAPTGATRLNAAAVGRGTRGRTR
jgi:hypothetical protein